MRQKHSRGLAIFCSKAVHDQPFADDHGGQLGFGAEACFGQHTADMGLDRIHRHAESLGHLPVGHALH